MSRADLRAPRGLIDDLRGLVRGRVIGPGDDDYDRARTVVAGHVDRRPAAIVRVLDADDVSAVVRYAAAHGAPLAVRSGGHSNAGHGVLDDGIVIDLREMKAVEVDVAGRTAWAETGITAAAFSSAVGAHGLAVGFGDTGSVGVGGITLGGGIGYLVRKHGATIDNLLAAEIVTADGAIRTVDADHDPDLFWAIRGGGGNFGVATRYRFRLAEVPAFVGGLLVLPATVDSVTRFLAENEAAPDELSTIVNVMPCPPMPLVPEGWHGRLVIFALVAYAGGAESADAVLAPYRSMPDAQPIADLVRPIPYPEIYPPDDPDYHPLAIARTLFVDDVSRPVIERLLERLESADAPFRVAQLRVLGGAYARVANDATAYAHRDRKVMVNVAAFYEGEDDLPARTRWVEESAADLAGGDLRGYVNFLADEGPERVRAAYPGATWERLRAIKRRYDPANLFRSNQNIPPAAA
jgi:FAD/FMN-containing dehydrogenase